MPTFNMQDLLQLAALMTAVILGRGVTSIKVVKNCTELTPPLNGYIDCTDGFKIYSSCDFLCNEGYYLAIPSDTRDPMTQDLCSASNTDPFWAFPANRTCEEILCPDLKQVSLTSSFNCDNQNYYNSKCDFPCPPGNDLSGSSNTLVCKEGDGSVGQWSIETSNCKPLVCDVITTSESVRMTCSMSNKWGSRCTFVCENGLQLTHEDSLLCIDPDATNAKALWSSEPPTCYNDPLACMPYDEEFNGGRVECTDRNKPGSVCIYYCKYSFYMVGEKELTCGDVDNDGKGDWDHTIPRCEEMPCPDLETIPVNIEFLCFAEIKIGAVCFFKCPAGAYLDSESLTEYSHYSCEDDRSGSTMGTWILSVNLCADIFCQPLEELEIPDGISYTCTAGNLWFSNCTFSCPEGKQLSSTESMYCIDSDSKGIWNRDIPTCIKVPPECISSMPPFSLGCKNAVWLDSGCQEAGSRYPGKLTPTELSALDSLSVSELYDKFVSLNRTAQNSNATAQIMCFGREFPPECSSLTSPITLDCKNALWLDAGCTANGSHYPSVLTALQQQELNLLSIVAVSERFVSYKEDADSNNAEAQMKCYGVTFPSSCGNYHGPHSQECLKSLWKSALCVDEGEAHPSKLSAGQLADLNSMTLSELSDVFATGNREADSGDRTSQMNCFGFEYPKNCEKYYGPHSMECLLEMWSKSRCTEDGLKHPLKLSPDLLAVLNETNLRDIQSQFDYQYKLADFGVTNYQKDCFEIVYPPNCRKYYGPHSIECLKTIWNMAKCVPEGTEYPTKLSSEQLKIVQSTGLKYSDPIL